ncbi:hypothetical protein BUALT_Bualt01G0134400 [Buddleja alternifolia]|uniref:Cytochrome P450 n=1 Tax=Buddleja alternifolia TaxID=168488 RepID=A0AAV6Y6X5_9LAMI|nr:hypothetical protein BUALT_Bualt01G0134400 [Buddleja alternifolia]
MFLAGTETSTLTIQWAMPLLLSHPKAMHELRQEIDDNVGHNRLINDFDLSELLYLRCVINETLRLYPPVPLLLPHFSSQNSIVVRNNVPKGTILLVNAWAMHRDPKLWDEHEPDKFNLERFQTIQLEKESYKFVSFGIGRRACPGAVPTSYLVALKILGGLLSCLHVAFQPWWGAYDAIHDISHSLPCGFSMVSYG